MVDPRIYRAAFLPALLALVVAMFSLEQRPPPLRPPLAPDAFDDQGVRRTLGEIVRSAPDRQAGSVGDRGLQGLVAARLRSLPGIQLSRDEFRAESNGDEVTMANLVGVLSGRSERQIVLLAARDSSRPPGGPSAADTALLLELARALAGVRHSKTIVIVSADGGQDDEAGARRFASSYPDREKVDAAIVLEDVAAADKRKPFLVPWSSGTERARLQLQRTVETALRAEVETDAGVESVPGQFIRLAWPLTLRGQGPLARHGFDALTLTSHGEVPLRPRTGTLADVRPERVVGFGRTALASVLAIDSAGALEPSPDAFLAAGRQSLPGWAVSLVTFALLAPVLAAALDGLARARRRGRLVGSGLRWTLATALPFLVLAGMAYAFELLDWLPATTSAALAPASRPTFAESAPALAALAILAALAWLVLRPLAAGRSEWRDPAGPEAALAVASVLGVATLLLWASNTFAALLLVPLAHLALLQAFPDGERRVPAGVMAMAAAALPAVALLYYGARLDLGLDPTRYALLLVTGGGSLANVLLVSALAGSSVAAVLVAAAGNRSTPPGARPDAQRARAPAVRT